MKTMRFDGEKLCTAIEEYYNGNIAIELYADDGEPYVDLTVNICELPEGLACIDTNNFPEAIDLIKKYDLGEFTNKSVKSGFCEYPVYKLNMENINKYALDDNFDYDEY